MTINLWPPPRGQCNLLASTYTRQSPLASTPVFQMEKSRKRKRDDACSTYLEGKSRKAYKDLEDGLRATACIKGTTSAVDTDHCTACPPVLTRLKPDFVAMVRQDVELRHCKRVLPNPKKPEKQHYQNLVAQNAWIRSNPFDALEYCSACIISTLGIGSERLTRQPSIKQREALTPVVDMSKPDVVLNRLEEFVVLPDVVDNTCSERSAFRWKIGLNMPFAHIRLTIVQGIQG